MVPARWRVSRSTTIASLMVDAVQMDWPACELWYVAPVLRSRSTYPTEPGRVARYSSAAAMRICRSQSDAVGPGEHSAAAVGIGAMETKVAKVTTATRVATTSGHLTAPASH